MTWPLIAALVAIGASLPLEAAQVPTATPPPLAPNSEIEVIEAESERYRRMTVPVSIGGRGPFRFMIDTGAQATVVSRDLADRLELFDRKTATLIGMASSRRVETTAIADVALGSRSFYIQNAPVVETANIGGADGILGLDGLQDQRVLFDFANEEIHVADAAELGGNRGFEIVVRARKRLGQLIITSARLDGVQVSLIVDTGAQGSIGNPALFERLRRSRAIGETTLTDINGVTLSGAVKLGGALDVGNAKVSNLPILFTDSPTFRALGLIDEPALVLGMEELKLFRRVAIDFKQGRVLFDLPREATLASTLR